MADQFNSCAELFENLTRILELFEILLNLAIKDLVRSAQVSSFWWATIHRSRRLRERLMLQALDSERRGVKLQQTGENDFQPMLVRGNEITSSALPIVRLHHFLVPPANSLRQSICTSLTVTIHHWQGVFFYPGSDKPWYRWNQARICFPPVKNLQINIFTGMTHFLSVSVRNDRGIRIWDVSSATRPHRKHYRHQPIFHHPNVKGKDDEDASDEEVGSSTNATHDSKSNNDDVIVLRKMEPQNSRSTLFIGEARAKA